MVSVLTEFHPDDWTEVTSGENVSPGDRRFMQSAGPFTLKPGAVNYITVGIPFAQAPSGNRWTSVTLLREIDDVCQALFENCFKVLDGPDAPTLVVQEMSNEVLLYITYDNPSSNNYGEKYFEIDPAIVRSYTDAERQHLLSTPTTSAATNSKVIRFISSKMLMSLSPTSAISPRLSSLPSVMSVTSTMQSRA